MPYRIPNWREYQGYQKRGPKWVKLHAAILRNRFWPRLSMVARATLPALWIVASEQSQDGTFDDDLMSLSHLLAMSVTDLSAALSELKSFDFIHSDGVVAEPAPEPSHQTERETETEAEKRDVYAPARDGELTDAEEGECDTEERQLLRNLVALRDSSDDPQAACDSLPRPPGQAPFNANRALLGGKSGIPRTRAGLTVRRRLNDALEARQRAQTSPLISEKNRQSFDSIDRVLGTGAYAGLALPGGKA